MLGCTLEGNQLRHCTAKLIVQLASWQTQVGFYTSHASIQGPTEYELDALPTEPLGLSKMAQSLWKKKRYSTDGWNTWKSCLKTTEKTYMRCG